MAYMEYGSVLMEYGKFILSMIKYQRKMHVQFFLQIKNNKFG